MPLKLSSVIIGGIDVTETVKKITKVPLIIGLNLCNGNIVRPPIYNIQVEFVDGSMQSFDEGMIEYYYDEG